MNRAQREALYRKYCEDPDGAANYRVFRRRWYLALASNSCYLGLWCGQWVGIEADGYTHT